MNDYTNSKQATPQKPVIDESPAFSTAALVIGILSMVLIATGLGVFLAPLGIIFGILSRGRSSMNSKALAGTILSIIGLVIGIAFTAYFFYAVSTGKYDDYIDNLKETYRTYMEEQNDPFSTADSSAPAMTTAYLQLDSDLMTAL